MSFIKTREEWESLNKFLLSIPDDKWNEYLGRTILKQD